VGVGSGWRVSRRFSSGVSRNADPSEASTSSDL
jgi:hypothetical protein